MKVLFTVAMIAVLGAALPGAAPPAAAQTLRQTPFDDGTGSIGLAPGWRIDSAYRGSVTCVGPGGAAVILGVPWAVFRPDTSLAGAHQQPRAYPGDILGALREVLAKRGGAALRSVSGNQVPGAFPGVPAYYLLYEFEQNGRVMTGMGYFTTLDYGPSSPAWQLYSSAVVAPREQFPQVLQTMLRMWRAWRPNGREPREGSSSALFDSLMRERQLSHERISREFRRLL